MIVVKVELHSARTGKVEEIGRAVICNTGAGTPKRGFYRAEVMRRDNPERVLRRGYVQDFPRQSYSVWRLIIRALRKCYPEEKC